jgi:hypothetical protein
MVKSQTPRQKQLSSSVTFIQWTAAWIICYVDKVGIVRSRTNAMEFSFSLVKGLDSRIYMYTRTSAYSFI